MSASTLELPHSLAQADVSPRPRPPVLRAWVFIRYVSLLRWPGT